MGKADAKPAAGRNSRHVVIGGGSGFIGSALSAALSARGDTVSLISSRCPSGSRKKQRTSAPQSTGGVRNHGFGGHNSVLIFKEFSE